MNSGTKFPAPIFCCCHVLQEPNQPLQLHLLLPRTDVEPGTSSSGEHQQDAAAGYEPSCHKINGVVLVREGKEVSGLANQGGKVCQQASQAA